MTPEGRERVAIVVGRHDYGETDRILRLLIPEEGRIGVMARGGRRRHAALDIGVRAVVRLRRGRGELDILLSADVQDARIHLREGYARLMHAAHACELCGAMAREGQPEPRLYGLCDVALSVLDAAMGDPGEAFLAGLEGKALTFAGIGPVLDRCVVCRDPVEPEMAFTASGLVHPRCGEGEPIAAEFAAALEAARRAPLRDLLDRGLPEGRRRMLADVIAGHLGREVVSRAALE